MQVETKSLRLTKPVALATGSMAGGYWIGGWDRCRVLFVVMVENKCRAFSGAFVPGCSLGFGILLRITGFSPGISEERR